MSDFDAEKEKEVELLKNSIDHLKSVHLKLEATAKAARERKEKAQQTAQQTAQQDTQGSLPLAGSGDKTATIAANEINALSPATPTPTGKFDEHLEINAVVDSLKLSEDELPKDEFHGIHSK